MSRFTAVDHIDLVVEDVGRLSAFLISLGFHEVRRTDHNGGAIELRFPGAGEQPMLELTPASAAGRDDLPLGLRHLALRCDDLDDTYGALVSEGYDLTGPPKTIAHTGRRLTNIRAPEIGVLQIVDSPIADR